MRKTIVLLGLWLTLKGLSYSQDMPGSSPFSGRPIERGQVRKLTSHDPNFKRTSELSFYKRKSEWQKIIDNYWGPGASLTQKLGYFDYFSSFVRAYNPTFAYAMVNWDSVSEYWRSKITDSTSRGGFSAILSYLAYQLNDGPHAWACDTVLYSTPLNPGTPLLVGFPFDYVQFGAQHFGAALTVLPDTSLLVYRVVPNHPLGLEPGDKVLGYEGAPWRKIVRELIAAQVPIVAYTGTSPSAAEYYLEYCAGMNWHLFDTIDVVKYRTGQRVHLSTDTLLSLQTPASWLVDGAQLPVPGVPMPSWYLGANGWAGSPAVTYGTVNGTPIGYIYVYHHQLDNVGADFNAAVTALANTQGIILDLRFDNGGWVGLNAGIARLTSYAGPTLMSLARSSPSDLWSLVPFYTQDYGIPQDNLRYEHPIAVLLGPGCLSYGDITARQLTYLDKVRFFGRSPKGIYTGVDWRAEPKLAGFDLACADVTLVDSHFPNVQLWARDFPLNEEVWLTPDGVAKGEDDVVKRALEWIAATNGVAEGEQQIPQLFALIQNYPNPFNPTTTIKYELPKSSVVRLSVFDMLGRELSVLVNDRRDAGVHAVKFDGSNLASGVYFYRLQAGDFASIRELVLLK